MAVSSNVVILTRTLMNGGVCVGAFDVINNRMLRLLTEKGQRLPQDAPFMVGEAYEVTYATHYHIKNPHTEDVAVYAYRYLDEVDVDSFEDLIESLCEQDLSLEEIFDGDLIWNTSAYMTPANCTDYSVQIATLTCDLTKNGEYYEYASWGNQSKKIKYVGIQPIENLPMRIIAGTPIRFSLARFWDKDHDGVLRAYLQISGIY
jgi:hypothetical protein